MLSRSSQICQPWGSVPSQNHSSFPFLLNKFWGFANFYPPSTFKLCHCLCLQVGFSGNILKLFPALTSTAVMATPSCLCTLRAANWGV